MDRGGFWRARRLLATSAGALLALTAAACGGAGASAGNERGSQALRLGYFPNVTHATALAGMEKGIFGRALGPGIRLEPTPFNAGPAAVEALFSGAIDATYIGPNPAINAFVRSKGEAIRVIAGATSGGAFLVVRPAIRSAADLKGKTVASPQLGNTQDVALRAWLDTQGLTTDPRGGGDVSVAPQENAQTLETMRSGEIAGAWLPEPWATRAVLEAGAKVLIDERDLWPGGRYVTTHLIVATSFLRQNPEAVERLLRGHVEATGFVNDHPGEARRLTNDAIARLTGTELREEVISRAWRNLSFTVDPIASSLRRSAADARSLGFLEHVDLGGIYDLALLNEVLRAAGEAGVSAG